MFAGSFIALAFLVYSLLNLGRLGIEVWHPRVLVELGLAVGLLALGLVMYAR
jgi:hypothetical protein